MKMFYILTVFIALAIVGLGLYLIVETVTNWQQSYFAAARIVLGCILALTGLILLVAMVVITVADKVAKHRMKNKGGKQ